MVQQLILIILIQIDPVVLFKIVFIQYIFGIKSMRQTINQIQINNAYRWFFKNDKSWIL